MRRIAQHYDAELALASSTPADNSTSVNMYAPLTFTFGENVYANATAGKLFYLYKADGTLVESFDAKTLAGSQGGSLSINGNTVTAVPETCAPA